jgi:hypothetical protein
MDGQDNTPALRWRPSPTGASPPPGPRAPPRDRLDVVRPAASPQRGRVHRAAEAVDAAAASTTPTGDGVFGWTGGVTAYGVA